MSWYYADNGRQVGPIDDTEFQSLVTRQIIKEETLVWREGMPNWEPYTRVKPTTTNPTPDAVSAVTTDASDPATSPSAMMPSVAPAGGSTTGGPEVVCAECGKIFSKQNTIQYGDSSVCAACKPVFVQKLQEGAVPGLMEETYSFAGFWIRFVAKIVDSLILMFAIGIPLGIIIYLSFDNIIAPGQTLSSQIGLQAVINLFSMLVPVAYNTFFIGRYGATPGKMVVGVRVITAEGHSASYWRAFGRAWADVLSGLICYIGYIIAAFDSEKRALHDHICNTRVVYK